jgi:dolichol-phosphate mannosyltransferase
MNGQTTAARIEGAQWVVVPTYNEAGNLEQLVPALLAALHEQAERFAILVVDDDSPDGTGDVADALAAAHPEVRVLHRTSKSGLGAAYLAGFSTALAGGASHVVQMDADLSHDPLAVPGLLRAADDADLVLGSRYVKGGGTPEWPLRRRLISRSGCLYARAVLNLGVRDLTGGFKCWRAGLLARVLAEGITSQGYVFQIETTLRATRRGAVIREIPIVFRDRELGRSKMSADVVREAVVRVPRLRFGGGRRAARAKGRLAVTSAPNG